MRKLLTQRLNELKRLNENFTKSLMRWQNFMVNGIHISECKFEDLNDDDLLYIFEAVIKRCSKQM
jgi:hypothetical protein